MKKPYDPTERSAALGGDCKKYEIPEAVEEIDRILSHYSPDCRVSFFDNELKIRNSYRISSRQARRRICAIIAGTGRTHRSPESLCAEWLLHNLAYKLYVRRSSSRDLDLDYIRDSRWLVNFATWLFEKLHMG